MADRLTLLLETLTEAVVVAGLLAAMNAPWPRVEAALGRGTGGGPSIAARVLRQELPPWPGCWVGPDWAWLADWAAVRSSRSVPGVDAPSAAAAAAPAHPPVTSPPWVLLARRPASPAPVPRPLPRSRRRGLDSARRSP